MEVNAEKIVDFHMCNTCKYKNDAESSDKCHDCLNEPVNLYSHRPINYEPDSTLTNIENN